MNYSEILLAINVLCLVASCLIFVVIARAGIRSSDVKALKFDLDALEERFSRFQNREGMRKARSAKEIEEERQNEAHSILSASGGPEHGSSGPVDKNALRRKLRGLQ